MSSTDLALFKQLLELQESSSESDSNAFHSDSSDEGLVLLELALMHNASKNTINTNSDDNKKQYKQIKSHEWYETILFQYDETRFRHMLIMSKSTFNKLVNKICGHEVFQSTGRKSQRPPEFQLAVTLQRLGSKCDIFEIASKFGISEGSVSKYQERVTKAIKSLKQQYIVWPQDSYKEEVKQGFEDICGFS